MVLDSVVPWVQDSHTGKARNKYTLAIEVLPICKDDVVWLPPPTANAAGQISPLLLCTKVSNVLHFVDARTLQSAELQPLQYWKAPFKAALGRQQLIEFVVLDIERDLSGQRSVCYQSVISLSCDYSAACSFLHHVTIALSDTSCLSSSER